jgi:hypothetical protein
MSITLNGTTGITTPASTVGGSAVLTTASTIAASALPAGSVVQVLQAVKADTWSTTSNILADITGMSVSITPKSATNKILVIVQMTCGTGDARMNVNLYRNSTGVYVGDTAGSRQRVSAMTTYTPNYQGSGMPIMISYLDSPATTSSITYKVMASSDTNGYATYVNRSGTDGDAAAYWRSTSSITVMEIAE